MNNAPNPALDDPPGWRLAQKALEERLRAVLPKAQA